MAFDDPLQLIIIGILVIGVGGVLCLVAYFLFRILRTLDKADRYFDSKEKGSEQPG